MVVRGADYTARLKGGSEVERGKLRVHGGGGDKSGSAESMALELKNPADSADRRLRCGYPRHRADGPHLSARTFLAAALGQADGRRCRSSPPRSGSVAGLPAAEVPASHFAVMVRGRTQVFAGGPPLVARSQGETISKEELGGYEVHARKSGVVDNDAEDEQDLMAQIRAFLSYLPTNVHQLPPRQATDDPPARREQELVSIIPRHRNRGYNPRRLNRAGCRPRLVFRAEPLLRARAGDRVRAHQRVADRRAGQRSDALRRCDGRARSAQV